MQQNCPLSFNRVRQATINFTLLFIFRAISVLITAISVLITAISVLITATGVAAAAPDFRPGSETETIIINAIDANYASAHSLLEQVVNINSGSLNIAGVREVGGVFMREFAALGFSTRWVTDTQADFTDWMTQMQFVTDRQTD